MHLMFGLTTFKYYNSDKIIKHLYSLKNCTINLPDTHVECCANEKELLQKVSEIVYKRALELKGKEE